MIVMRIGEKVWRKLQKGLLIHTNFISMISISLFYCCKKCVYPYEYMDDWEKI